MRRSFSVPLRIAGPAARLLAAFERRAALLAALAAVAIVLAEALPGLLRSGGVPHWRGWYDQGQYLVSAQAFARLDFDPALHRYPPLYALLAAPFTWLWPAEPFPILNAGLLAATTALLVRLFADLAGGRIVAGLFALAFLLMPGVAAETFATPWTSTLAAALIVAALSLLKSASRPAGPGLRGSLLFGLALGLLVPTRPLDAVVALVLLPPWMVALWSGLGPAPPSRRLPAYARHLAAGALGAAAGPALLIGSNLLIHGGPFSPYMAMSATMFDATMLGRKTVAILFDSAGLSAEPGQTLMTRFPWLTLALCAALVCLWLGPLWLRAAACLAGAQFALHLAYLDLLPNGLFRYLNYHYFKWALWLVLLMVPAAWGLLRARGGAGAWMPAGLALAVAGVAACLQFSVTLRPAALALGDGRAAIDLPQGEPVDFVDIAGLSAGFDATFNADQQSWLDGRPIAGMLRLRAVPTPDGTRFLFLNPIAGRRLEIAIPAPTWSLGEAPAARTGRAGVALAAPAWPGWSRTPLPHGAPLRLDSPAGDRLFGRGFGPYDGQGRALDAARASLRLPLAPAACPCRLRLTIAAAEPAAIAIEVAGAGRHTFVLEGAGRAQDVAIAIPPGSSGSAWLTRPATIVLSRDDAAAAGAVRVVGLRID